MKDGFAHHYSQSVKNEAGSHEPTQRDIKLNGTIEACCDS
jgi:hypothetical protein